MMFYKNKCNHNKIFSSIISLFAMFLITASSTLNVNAKIKNQNKLHHLSPNIITDNNEFDNFSLSIFILYGYLSDTPVYINNSANYNYIFLSKTNLLNNGYLSVEALNEISLDENHEMAKFKFGEETCHFRVWRQEGERSDIGIILNNRSSKSPQNSDYKCFLLSVAHSLGIDHRLVDADEPAEIVKKTIDIIMEK